MRKITRNQLRQLIIQETRQLNRLDEVDTEEVHQLTQIELLRQILAVLTNMNEKGIKKQSWPDDS